MAHQSLYRIHRPTTFDDVVGQEQVTKPLEKSVKTRILRRYFLYDRKLLADLSRCAWESLKVFLQHSVPENDPIPGAVIAMQTFGDFLGINPHCHILVTDGCFYDDGGMFRVAPPLELKKLEAIFRHNVFKMLLAKGKITRERGRRF